VSAGESAFGPSLDWAYREYIVRRLSAGEANQAVPLGDAPAQLVDTATRRRQLQSLRPLAQLAGPDELRLCLFNVLVALEWLPDQAYMRQLEWAFRRASDFLYDVTDGMMAFGQVVFGGPELMNAADIQIMASNRLLSRSWVSGLHIERKYMPIRVGRGVWHRNNRVIIPWNEPEAYRTLIHEWGHYALEQRDAYAVPQQLTSAATAGLAGALDQLLIPAKSGENAPYAIIMPHMGLASESVMATTEGNSELLAHTAGSGSQHKSDEWSIILRRFPWLNPSAQSLEGPGRLPLPLPRFHRLGAPAEAAPTADMLLRTFPQDLHLNNCWVYLLKGMSTGRADPERVIAQGTLESRSVEQGFRLLGAQPGDTLVLIGSDQAGNPLVYRGAIEAAVGDGQAGIKKWYSATPDAFPAIAVVPDAMETPGKLARVRVRVDSDNARLPDQVRIFPLGQARAEDAFAFGAPDRSDWISPSHDVPTLDGHVLLRWDDGTLLISSFSQGGGPATGSPNPANPLTAGSSDGKALLFFYDENRAAAYAADPSTFVSHTPQIDYSGVKVITTMIYGLRGAAPEGAHGLGTAFSMAANAALPSSLTPTLVLYYDTPDERDLLAGNVRICRLIDGVWTPLPTYLPAGYPFAVAPLTLETAGSLVAEDVPARIEYYRIFWLPRSRDMRAA
jgi:hypothetical protein